MGLSHRLFGTEVVPSNDPNDAIGAALHHGRSIVRPPLAVARIALKLAGGRVVDLTTTEIAQLDTLGIALERINLTDADRTQMRNDAIAAGSLPELATLEAQTARGGFRSIEMVSLATYFKPASR